MYFAVTVRGCQDARDEACTSTSPDIPHPCIGGYRSHHYHDDMVNASIGRLDPSLSTGDIRLHRRHPQSSIPTPRYYS
jgi:hypothetical protein